MSRVLFLAEAIHQLTAKKAEFVKELTAIINVDTTTIAGETESDLVDYKQHLEQLSRRLGEIVASIQKLQEMQQRTREFETGKVRVGSIVSNSDGKKYFVFPYLGGTTILLEGQQIFFVSPGSPMGKAILGEKVDVKTNYYGAIVSIE